MNKEKFTHKYTPPELREINHKISEILDKDEIDDRLLLDAISERDQVVNDHIEQLDKDSLKNFASAELEINNQLSELAQSLYRDSLSNLSRLVKGRKAVQKYK